MGRTHVPAAVCRNERHCGRRNPIPLDTVVASLSQSLPQQWEQLALLKRVAAYSGARLNAQFARPQTYVGDMALTPQQCSIRVLAHVSGKGREAQTESP